MNSFGSFVFLLIFYSCFADELLVHLPNGSVRGTTFSSSNGQTFYAWRGIPYAQPPLGKLRFMPPVKVAPWEGILNATTDRKGCYYVGKPFIKPSAGCSEDCLFVNVYSPEKVDEKTKPNRSVLFWIYGGALEQGSGDFICTDPTPFLEQGLIVVTINYRLTALGFLSTVDDVVLGNAGLKDQQLALVWTRDNIEFFGGNSSDVTIMGESAGGISVGSQLISPKSKGLFKGAIMQGGNSLSDFFKTTKQAKYLTYLLASKIDPRITQANNSLEVKNLLQSAPVEDIIRYANGIKPRFSTVLEVESENSFLTRPVYESLENGDFVRVPTIIGYNSEECLAWYDDINSLKEKGQTLDGDYKKLVPNMPLRDNIDKKEVAAEIKEFYVGKNGSFADDLPAVLRWQSEDRFVRTTYKQAVLQSKYVPVYLYRFSFVGTPSSIHISIPGAGKVGHGADVPFFFNVSRVPLKTEQDFITRQRLVTLWSNFIKTSNPTPDDRPAADILENIVWRAASPSDVEELDIGDKLVLRKSKKVKELIFWDHIWNTYSYRPYNTF